MSKNPTRHVIGLAPAKASEQYRWMSIGDMIGQAI